DSARGEAEPEHFLDPGRPRYGTPVASRVGRAQQRAAGAAAQNRDTRGRGRDPRAVGQGRQAKPTGIVNRANQGKRTPAVRRKRELGRHPRRTDGPDDSLRGRDEPAAQLGKARTFPWREAETTVG